MVKCGSAYPPTPGYSADRGHSWPCGLGQPFHLEAGNRLGLVPTSTKSPKNGLAGDSLSSLTESKAFERRLNAPLRAFRCPVGVREARPGALPLLPLLPLPVAPAFGHASGPCRSQ